jgi:RND family efflux transporter MFP subunit
MVRIFDRTGLFQGLTLAFLAFSVPACKGAEPDSNAKEVGQKQAVSFPVKMAKVQPRELELTVKTIGSLFADEAVPIKARVEERVEELYVEEGSYVEQGKLLCVFYDKKIQQELLKAKADVAEAIADLANARVTLSRKEALVKKEMVSKQDYDDAKTRVELAKARLDQMRASLGLAEERFKDTRILAPLPGFIQARYISPGQYMKVADDLFLLLKTDPIKLTFTIPESEVYKVKIGQVVRMRTQAYPGELFTGGVYYIAPGADQSSRMVTLKAYVPNPEALLKPGFFADVEVVVGKKADAIFIPEGALTSRRGKSVVYVLEGDTARERVVATGVRERGLVEILSGLKQAERIVTDGSDALEEGMKVRVVS